MAQKDLRTYEELYGANDEIAPTPVAPQKPPVDFSKLSALFPEKQVDPYADLSIDATDEPVAPGAPAQKAAIVDPEKDQYNNQGSMKAKDWMAFRRAYEAKKNIKTGLAPLPDPSKPNLHALDSDVSARNVGVDPTGKPLLAPYTETPTPMRLPSADGLRVTGPEIPKTKEQAVAEYVAKSKGITLPEGFGRNISRLVADIGSNIRGKTGAENDPYFNELQQRADMAPEIAQKREFTQAANDPKSDVSAMGREMAGQMLGKPVPEGMSWAKVQQILGPASKLMDQRLEQQYKMAALNAHNATAKAAGSDDPAVAVPGFKADPSIKVQPAQAQKLRDSKAEFDSFNKNLANMKALQSKYGNFELGGEGAAQMASLHSDMLINLKNMAELGAITGPDMKIIEGQLADPSSFMRIFSDNKAGAASLNQLEKNMANKFYNKMAASGYTPVGGAPQAQAQPQLSQADAEALAWANANPKDSRAAEIKKRLGGK